MEDSQNELLNDSPKKLLGYLAGNTQFPNLKSTCPTSVTSLMLKIIACNQEKMTRIELFPLISILGLILNVLQL